MTDSYQATLLVVDDQPGPREAFVQALSATCQVITAASAAEALGMAAALLPDLVLLKHPLPDMTGLECCRRLKDDPTTMTVPVLLISQGMSADEAQQGLNCGAVDILEQGTHAAIIRARVANHLSLANQKQAMENLVAERTALLHANQQTLRKAMKNLRVSEITAGVFWLQVPEADLYLLCGCPAEVVKHMLRTGYILTEKKGETLCETGPNALLLSDLMVQNGDFSNLAEFPVLQMLYRQGMMLPNHPNNTGAKPLIIGSERQVLNQLDYIHRGNYGLLSMEELQSAGVDKTTAEWMMRIKRRFAFGEIRAPSDFLQAVVVGDGPVEIKNNVTIQRLALNRFEFRYRDQTVEVDLNLAKGKRYQAPYTLDFHLAPREYFSVLHTGEGDGWDIHRPSMASVLLFHGRIYLVDAPPNVTHTLEILGIDISEVEGIFHTHAHDDHFAGLVSLMQSDHRIKYFSSAMVRASVNRKLTALLGGTGCLEQFFVVHDLVLDRWNNCDELLVKPIFSPHPVETNILLFRVDDAHGAKTYAHWADLTAFDVLDSMAGEGADEVPVSFMRKIKEAYLTPANLKKLDIGGSMIHGRAEDFRDDSSSVISLAHIARPLTDGEKEIGSAAPFGAVEVLVPSTRHYLRDLADRGIRAIFPHVPLRKLEALINVPIVTINPGSIIRRKGEPSPHVDMILTGGVEYLLTSASVRHRLASGAMIGEQALFSEATPKGTWRAVSHVRVLRFPLALLRAFIEENGLVEDMKQMLVKVNFLRETWLFGEKLAFTILIGLARVMQNHSLRSGEVPPMVSGKPLLYLVRSGRLACLGGQEPLGPGDIWGEAAILGRRNEQSRCMADGATELVSFPGQVLLDIPILHWKLLETADRRRLTARWTATREQP